MPLDKVKRRLVLTGIKLLQQIRITKYYCLSSAVASMRPRLHQPVQFSGLGEIVIHGRVNIGIYPSPFFLSGYGYIEARHPSASITIGNGTWINNNFVAIAEFKRISIGQRVLIGTCVEILESDFHGLAIDKRTIVGAENATGIVIEDNVFIGNNVKIMKGVKIGFGSVIGNGSVVVHDVPQGVVAAGNPARVIRNL
ncbi:MAG: acyltransferase [Methylococcaceae bacterium]|nr:acyltransferase [Methylococcaceae bacterium]